MLGLVGYKVRHNIQRCELYVSGIWWMYVFINLLCISCHMITERSYSLRGKKLVLQLCHLFFPPKYQRLLFNCRIEHLQELKRNVLPKPHPNEPIWNDYTYSGVVIQCLWSWIASLSLTSVFGDTSFDHRLDLLITDWIARMPFMNVLIRFLHSILSMKHETASQLKR